MLFTDPNSPEGLRHRARKLIREGYALDNPYVSFLLKQALLKEGRENEIPDPNDWDKKNAGEREDWVLKQLGGKIK